MGVRVEKKGCDVQTIWIFPHFGCSIFFYIELNGVNEPFLQS